MKLMEIFYLLVKIIMVLINQVNLSKVEGKKWIEKFLPLWVKVAKKNGVSFLYLFDANAHSVWPAPADVVGEEWYSDFDIANDPILGNYLRKKSTIARYIAFNGDAPFVEDIEATFYFWYSQLTNHFWFNVRNHNYNTNNYSLWGESQAWSNVRVLWWRTNTKHNMYSSTAPSPYPREIGKQTWVLYACKMWAEGGYNGNDLHCVFSEDGWDTWGEEFTLNNTQGRRWLAYFDGWWRSPALMITRVEVKAR